MLRACTARMLAYKLAQVWPRDATALYMRSRSLCLRRRVLPNPLCHAKVAVGRFSCLRATHTRHGHGAGARTVHVEVAWKGGWDGGGIAHVAEPPQKKTTGRVATDQRFLPSRYDFASHDRIRVTGQGSVALLVCSGVLQGQG
jgi:hypothetical protein